MLKAVTAINREIQELAPILNSPTITGKAVVRSNPAEAPVAMMMKQYGDVTYLFAVGMRNAPTQATFEIQGAPEMGFAEVLGEGRGIPVRNGQFEDDFAAYDVHLYRLARF
jgi:hypothetical protein